jgi:hypothetical protein
VILLFLWIAMLASTVVALFAILFTDRYPRTLVQFNVGVLRWTWRVGFYTYNALGTDRYPPFTLQDDPDYPARLEVEYPHERSRRLALVKWWLLAIPHYLIVAVFLDTGWTLWGLHEGWGAWPPGATRGAAGGCPHHVEVTGPPRRSAGDVKSTREGQSGTEASMRQAGRRAWPVRPALPGRRPTPACR